MIRHYTLAIVTLLLSVSLPGVATAKSGYVPIRQSVAQGTYHSPNYLSVVNSAVGREGVYQTFCSVIETKYPHAVGRFGKDEFLIHALRKQKTQRRQVLGLYAEDRFVDVNRDAGWRKVNSPFAPQRDVWRRTDGRVEFGQIKVHGLGRSAPTLHELAGVYLDSMRKDSGRGQARLFLVPDDHVDAIDRLLNQRYAVASRRGDKGEATWLLKQKTRISPLGVTYETLSREAELAQQASRARIVARYAGPMITVAYLAGTSTYETYRWSSGQISHSDFGVQLGKSGSIVTLSLMTSFTASKVDFLKANPYRVGGMATAVTFIAEEGWMIYQYGGFLNAFSSREFLVKTGGNLGSVGLTLIGVVEGGKLGAIVGSPLGPGGIMIGGGLGSLAGGAIGGTVGYFGGATITDWMLETYSPEFYYGMKVDAIADAERKLSEKIGRLSDLSNPLFAVE